MDLNLRRTPSNKRELKIILSSPKRKSPVASPTPIKVFSCSLDKTKSEELNKSSDSGHH